MKKSLIFKILYLFLVLIVVAGASVFATNTYLASQISYGNSNVENALNDLYKLKGNDENYSTDEKVVGKWIDGKPIYRKVIILEEEVLPTKNWTARFSIPDSKELINVVVKTNDNTIRTSGALFKIENEYFKDWQLSEYCAYQTVIVEYTKTTDNPTNN